MTQLFEPYVSIEINSKDRDNGDIESFKYLISNQITFNQSNKKSYFMRLENVLIPKTFYDIDSTNNTFQVLEEDGIGGYDTITIVIPEGNYTITELLTQLESDLDTDTMNTNAYTLAYDDINNLVSFEYAGATSADVIIDTIANGSTLNELLGFSKETSTLQTINGLSTTDATQTFVTATAQYATYAVDLDTKSYVIVETDITSNNFYDKNTQKHVGVIVPMNVDRNEKQHMINDGGHMTKMNSKSPLSSISFKLVDEYNNQIDLNGVNWSCEFNIYAMTEIHKK